jgi:hypothetical protein
VIVAAGVGMSITVRHHLADALTLRSVVMGAGNKRPAGYVARMMRDPAREGLDLKAIFSAHGEEGATLRAIRL